MKHKNWKKYYEQADEYLREHKDFFSPAKTKAHTNFIIKALNLKKSDRIIDLGCGDGRITVGLAKKGFDVEGLDFSKNLLRMAKRKAKKNGLSINFYHQDLHHLDLKHKYNKTFLFFSHFGILNPEKVFKNIGQILAIKGRFLLDCDNLFRLVAFLLRTKNERYFFNTIDLRLYDNKQDDIPESPERYYFYSEVTKLMLKNGIRPIKVYGDYHCREYLISSPRMIIVGEKEKKKSRQNRLVSFKMRQ